MRQRPFERCKEAKAANKSAKTEAGAKKKTGDADAEMEEEKHQTESMKIK